ncbi:MAG TPA: hypothetical protein VM510_06410 [Caulifigura sp.]|nr:hypothetical protein [Caulifigura sp.]
MLRRTIERLLISGTTLGALATAIPASSCDQADQAFASGSLVQAYGTAPPAQAYGSAPSNPMNGPPGGMAGQSGPPVQLVNDSSTGGDVWFLIDGQEKSLKPGETLDLQGGQPHLVEFNTAGQSGDVKFTLYQGLYKFKVGAEGWGLFKSSSQPSMAAHQPGGMIQDRRGFHPPLPAEDLRTRRVARGTSGAAVDGQRSVDPQPKPADTTSGRDATHSISAPPAPGVTRERTRPATAP